jgi:hypothetical protein
MSSKKTKGIIGDGGGGGSGGSGDITSESPHEKLKIHKKTGKICQPFIIK